MSVPRKGPPLTLGALLGIVALAGVAGYVAVKLPEARDSARRAAGGGQLKTLYLTFRLYAKDHGSVFPPLDTQAGRLMADRVSIYPEYLVDVTMLAAWGHDNAERPTKQFLREQAPSGEEAKQYIDDHSYIYLGYALATQTEGLAWVEAYRKQAESGGGFDEDLPAPAEAGSLGTNRFYRLRPDFRGFLEGQGLKLGSGAPPDAQIPVFIERPGHYPRWPGGWVSFLDGHGEYIPYPGKFPMTKKFIEALESLDALEKDTE